MQERLILPGLPTAPGPTNRTCQFEPVDGDFVIRAHACRYSTSKPCDENLSVRLFSVTVLTAFSGTPSGTIA